MLDASLRILAWAMLISIGIVGLSPCDRVSASQPRGRATGNGGMAFVTLQDDGPQLAPELPAPEEEASTAPVLNALPTPAGDSIDSPLVQDDELWLFDSEGMSGEILGDSIPTLGCDSCDLPAPVYSSGTWFRRGSWYGQLDFVMMLQSKPHEGTVPDAMSFLLKKGLIAFDTFASTRVSRTSRNFSIDTDSPGFEPGTRLTFGRMLGRDAANRDHAVEFSFLGFFDWSAQAEFAGVAASFNQPAASIRTLLGGVVLDSSGSPTAIFVPGFSDADVQAYQYSSDLDSFEMNIRVNGRPGRDVVALQPDGTWVRHDGAGRLYSFLGGLRVVTANSSFLYSSESAEIVDDDSGDVIAPETRGLYTVLTHNDMVGVHFGLDITEKYTEWCWGVRGRVGGLVNFADRSSRIQTLNGIDPRSETIDEETYVTLLEGGLFTTYFVRPNLALRSGYDVIGLIGTADVEKNLSLQPTFPAFNLEGSRFYHALSLGIEFVW